MTDVAEGERRILVAVDEGEESMYALSWCLKNIVPQNSKDTLILLYAKPPRAVFTALDGTGYLFSSETWAAMEKYAADVADCVMEKAKKTCRDLRQDVNPRDVISQMAEQLRADVLVVGSHGYGGIKRAFLGSVSNHCAQNVNCPVLIVKKPKTNAGSKSQ
ncbi:unnamed protein product [Malus baccata var. baccata]